MDNKEQRRQGYSSALNSSLFFFFGNSRIPILSRIVEPFHSEGRYIKGTLSSRISLSLFHQQFSSSSRLTYFEASHLHYEDIFEITPKSPKILISHTSRNGTLVSDQSLHRPHDYLVSQSQYPSFCSDTAVRIGGCN
jgi:hypothetical protein